MYGALRGRQVDLFAVVDDTQSPAAVLHAVLRAVRRWDPMLELGDAHLDSLLKTWLIDNRR
jgi:hypothetical protein